MHELSIALSIVDLAAEEAARRGGARLIAVHLKLGLLSGVDSQALAWAFELAAEGSPLRDSRLVIEEVPIMVYCANCRCERGVESIQSFRCAVCGTPATQVVRGREMEVVALEIEEENDPSNSFG